MLTPIPLSPALSRSPALSISQIAKALEVADELWPIVEQNAQLRKGSYAGGLEEYAEAVVFAHFIRTGKILPSSELKRCDADEYLGGVLDFTGELNRRGVGGCFGGEGEGDLFWDVA